ncbi:MAG TPA: hypothetical protein VMU37_01715, partial [Caulobacteraceae bacterium]|nr:hypothetical protein [Caulobacteraceae bacterium]
LIEAIYNETNPRRRKAFIATLAEEEAKRHPAPSADETVRRRTIERLTELIYKETDPDSRIALLTILAEEEAKDGAATRLPRRSRC